MSPKKKTASFSSDYSFYDENHKPMFNRGISRKIGESAFVQQTLPTYRVTWSPIKIGPFFLLVGAFFTGLGIGIKVFSDNVGELTLRYTHCESLERPNETCYDILKNANSKSPLPGMPIVYRKFVDASSIENCTCRIQFHLDKPLNNTVRLFYGLTNFYQNHRLHYISRDENQLKGDLFDKKGKPKDPYYGCEPMDKDDEGKIIYPCGLMANSMFTDLIELVFHAPMGQLRFLKRAVRDHDDTCIHYGDVLSTDITVPMRKTGIAWESDREEKYQLPSGFENRDDPKWKLFAKPWGWKTDLWGLDPQNASNNGVLNEDFIVWMRTAAFPWFRKLHRVVNSKCFPFEKGLPTGNYSLFVQYNYDVSGFKGEKEIILTTTSMVGGKNTFLAVVYLATGALCIFLAFLVVIVHKAAKYYQNRSSRTAKLE